MPSTLVLALISRKPTARFQLPEPTTAAVAVRSAASASHHQTLWFRALSRALLCSPHSIVHCVVCFCLTFCLTFCLPLHSFAEQSTFHPAPATPLPLIRVMLLCSQCAAAEGLTVACGVRREERVRWCYHPISVM